MYHLGWFSTGRDEAARQLLTAAYDAIHSGEIHAVIDFVFISRAPGESGESDSFIELVKGYGLPLISCSYQQYKSSCDSSPSSGFPEWRLRYDRKVMSLLEGFKPDLCVLAGYMLIVGPEMCRNFNMINLHPAAPGGPTGTWQEVIWQLIENGAQETGVMMHLVTPELDRGPVVSFCTFSLRDKPFDSCRNPAGKPGTALENKGRHELFRLIREQGLKREFPLIIRTIKAFSEGRVRIETGEVVDMHGHAITGYNLTREIDRLL
jgi:phosphoribosylglycinamide formyltransferase-1